MVLTSCEFLKSLDLSNFDTSKVTTMNYMFFSCLELESLDILNFDTSNVKSFVCMFYNSPKLTSVKGEVVTPPGSDTTKMY